MNKYFYSLLIAFCFTISSCDLFTEPAVKYNPTEQVLSNFNAVIVDYDSVSFSSHFDIYLKSKSVKEIAFTVQGDSGFVELQRIEPTYIRIGDQYRLDFEYAVGPEIKREAGLPSSSMIENYKIIFYLDNGDTVIVEKYFEHYKYPYISAEILFTDEERPKYDINGSALWLRIQDFEITGEFVFYILGNNSDIYIYDYIKNTVEKLYFAWLQSDGSQHFKGVGEIADIFTYNTVWIALFDINTMFVVDDDYSLQLGVNKLDLFQNTAESYIQGTLLDSLAGFNNYQSSRWLPGIEINTEYLIIATSHLDYSHDAQSSNKTVLIFDHSSNFIKSIDWLESYIIESYENILYSYATETNEIIRFDLNTNSFLEGKPAPSGACGNGFEIMNGRFYYSDWGAILSVPLEDIEN